MKIKEILVRAVGHILMASVGIMWMITGLLLMNDKNYRSATMLMVVGALIFMVEIIQILRRLV